MQYLPWRMPWCLLHSHPRNFAISRGLGYERRSTREAGEVIVPGDEMKCSRHKNLLSQLPRLVVAMLRQSTPSFIKKGTVLCTGK
jgi:hypothetical protein